MKYKRSSDYPEQPQQRKATMTSPTFVPQPYPLFAATFETAGDPARFEPTSVPVHLVLGWVTQEGQLRPVLDGSPELKVWAGAISYHETRAQAEATVQEMEKAARDEIQIAQIVRRLTGAKDDVTGAG
jgi:hypothetical protein